MRYRIIGIILVLFIVGCTTPTVCPILQCPETEEEQETEEDETVIDAGTVVYLIKEEERTDIINCGRTSYGSVVVDEIKERNLELRNLIINNTESNYIGGCKDILIAFPEIEKVHINDIERDTNEYKELIRWTPPSKLVINR